MVELCELNLMDNNLDCQWPPDIDQHIAQLDFDKSTDEDDRSFFSSIALDPSLISTDSLDLEKFRARCEVNKNDYKLTFEDSGQWASGNLTTWGRIRSTEPLDEKTNSLPELGNAPKTNVSVNRPSSLLATFVERQPDTEFAELYIGNGRYVDVNSNEIGFVPINGATVHSADRWRIATRLHSNPPSKPRRTFADFQQKAPPLDFMIMKHKTPQLCQSSISLSEVMLKMKEDEINDEKMDFSIFSVLEKPGPDSGLGSSSYASNGPSHIEDWSSLAILLPKHVVEACSFFKANSRLLCGSNNIERISPRKSEACRTCFSVRKRLHPPIWAQPSYSRHMLCDCTSSEIIERSVSRQQGFSVNRLKLHAQELSIVGLPIYDEKRTLIEKVVEGVAELARGGNSLSLCLSMETLIADGLKISDPWNMIVNVTSPGPATDRIHSLVKELDNNEETVNSRVLTFFSELIRLRSMDSWVCYVVLKENVLNKLYTEGAFMLQANTAFRSLLWRLLENLELIAFIEESDKTECDLPTMLLVASKIASDSRVPKSSSVPARLSNIPISSSNTLPKVQTRSSRIPQLRSRPKRSSSGGAGGGDSAASSNHSRTSFASAIEDLDAPGMLAVSRGERLRVFTTRGQFARCCRVRPRRDQVLQGLLPISNLVMMI